MIDFFMNRASALFFLCFYQKDTLCLIHVIVSARKYMKQNNHSNKKQKVRDRLLGRSNKEEKIKKISGKTLSVYVI